MKPPYILLVCATAFIPNLVQATLLQSRGDDAICKARCEGVSTTFDLVHKQIVVECYIPQDMINELWSQQARVLGDGCDVECIATTGRAGQEDEEQPGDTSIEARQMSCEELRTSLLAAFHGGFGEKIAKHEYIPPQSFIHVTTWQDQMGVDGPGSPGKCGPLVPTVQVASS